MADEILSSGGSPEPTAPAPAPPPGPPASMESRIAAAQGPAAPTPAPATPSASPAAAEWTGVRDFARGMGVEVPGEDDASSLQALIGAYQQLQQRNYYADLGQRVAPHADKFQQWVAQNNQPAPQQAPPWQAPPYQEDWLNLVERDPETGAIRSKPGYDPGIPDKIRAYMEWKNKFNSRPDEMLKPWVAQEAQEQARQLLAEHRQEIAAQSLVERESAWLFDKNRQLTPAGRAYGELARQLWDGGMRDVQQIHRFAKMTVMGALYSQRDAQAQRQAAAQAPAPAASSASPALALTDTIRNVNPQARGGSSAPPAPARSNPQPGMSLETRLRKKFTEAG